MDTEKHHVGIENNSAKWYSELRTIFPKIPRKKRKYHMAFGRVYVYTKNNTKEIGKKKVPVRVYQLVLSFSRHPRY